MKTKINICKFFLMSLTVLTILSCNNPVSLGQKLDIEGPVVNITSPSHRQSVPAQFIIEGTAEDLSGVDRILIKASASSGEFKRQWRYLRGVWEISDNYGGTWLPFADGQWTGDEKSGAWKIKVDMVINGLLEGEGEYTFEVQAWDRGGMTDDNSFKAVVLIIDLDPPKVDITNPYLFKGLNAYANSPLKELHDINDDSDSWKEPAYLGKFITQEFSLKWQIDDINDVWSIDLRFYNYDTPIDNDPYTSLPDDYIYRYYKNLPPPPLGADPNDYVKPNGAVTVPDLNSPAGIYEDGGEVRKPVYVKTTMKVVAVCYDAAGNPNQEKTLGYYIYWPKANFPWIVFTEGMGPPDDFYGKQAAYDENHPDNYYIENDVFMVYPGRNVRSTAFQAHGVKEIKYSLYKCDITGNKLNSPETHPFTVELENVIISNSQYNGTYSNIFPWELQVPPHTGYYVFTSEAFSSQGVTSEKYTMLFRVHDITFPDFPVPPRPDATEALFKAVINNAFTIEGTVSDATEIVSLCMVWINPESKGYSAMSQLSYFRDSNYPGWKEALKLEPGYSDEEKANPAAYGDKYPYDKDNPNRIWKLKLSGGEIDYEETNRKIYSYSQTVDLTSDLKIGIGKQPLKSQVLLFRAENPDGKCTIITYAPQGDTYAPMISISDVVIKSEGKPDVICIPNQYAVIQPFADNKDTIVINGTWREDSVEFLAAPSYFLPNFNIAVNNQTLPKPELSYSTPGSGTWTITAAVGTGQLSADKLKDTLVIGVDVTDIGGNRAEAGCSWLIQSDKLRLMRISAIDSVRETDGKEKEIGDGTYTVGQKIDIVLEFSKPVKLAYSGGVRPELILNSADANGARAVYKNGQTNQNSRHYFEYTIAENHSTGADYLNVTGLYHNGIVYNTDTPYDIPDYPFAWYNGEDSANSKKEEVRLTMRYGKDGNALEGTAPNEYYVRTLPTNTVIGNSDYQFTLTAAKHLIIDTGAPTVTNIRANTPEGDYDTGSNISVTVNFSKPVTIGAARPYLTMQVGSASVNTDTDNITVSNNESSGSITFMYNVKAGDTTNGTTVNITGYSGNITDLAGNALASGGISNTPLTGIYIDTIPLNEAPVVRLLTAANTANVINNTVNSSTRTGLSTETEENRTLATIYNQNLWLAIEGKTTAAHKLYALEYSFDKGNTWKTIAGVSNNNNPFPLDYQGGSYEIIARQRDRVGHTSPDSGLISFTWDRGSIINRISSTSANGTYTNNTGNGGTRADTINITVSFRKQVKFSTTSPSITLNTTPPATVTSSGYTLGNLVNELSFTYTVGENHNTPTGQKLDVTSFNLNTSVALDQANVKIDDQLKLDALPAGQRLNVLKDIFVQTGSLDVTGNVFDNSKVTGGGVAADSSYNTALVVTFNRNIVKGSTADKIIIIQQAEGYRLPAVLTESQFSRYRNVENVNKYYTRGSNGYNYTSTSDRGADTSTKYILNYNEDPKTITPSSTDSDIEKLAEAFRQAEKIELSINAQAVKTSGTQLIVELTGSNALQVPGANYLVSYPLGFVQDNLNTPCAAVPNQSIAIGGVAKPFIRINKKQETITINSNAVSTSQPRFIAVQPFKADVRMDCRTPGSDIYYRTTEAETNVTAVTTDPGNWSRTSTAPNDLNTPTAPDRPEDPQGGTKYNDPFQIGDDKYEGLQWYVRAKASKNGWSVDSDEMAFRTVVTYYMNNMVTDTGSASYQQLPAAGDQIWIRGGDAIGSSSVPGFPLTWDIEEFNKVKEDKKRAGIRLFTMTANTGTFANTSTWKWITWDINVDTYFDIILGRDPASAQATANEVWQYGPKQFAYQRAGWTSYKENSRILPGKHRWLTVTNNSPDKGVVNFSATLSARPFSGDSDVTYTQP